MTRPLELLSLKQYARLRASRGLPGGTVSAVFRAARDGRISRTCPAHPVCPPGCPDARIDPIKADVEWSARTAPRAVDAGLGSGPAGDAESELADYRERFARSRTAAAMMKAQVSSGVLIDRDKVWREGFRLIRGVRDSLLELPRRLAPVLAAERDPKKIERLIAAEFARAMTPAQELIERYEEKPARQPGGSSRLSSESTRVSSRSKLSLRPSAEEEARKPRGPSVPAATQGRKVAPLPRRESGSKFRGPRRPLQ